VNNQNYIKTILVTFLISLLLVACSYSRAIGVLATSSPVENSKEASITITDDLGRAITLENPAKRVVSLAPSNTEILYAIGAGPQVIGRDTFSDYPDETQKVSDIGGGFGELNLEAILALDPDLVLAANLTPPEQIEALENIGLTVFSIANPSDFDELYENLDIVARLTGHEGEALSLIAELKSRIAVVEEKIVRVENRRMVFYELDGSEADAPWTAGQNTFISTLINMAGGTNLGDRISNDWIQISAEELIAVDPEVIILGDYTWGGVTPEDVAARPGWGEITAVVNGDVHIFDDNLVSRPGPRLVDGLEAMAALLHPELFP